MWGEFNGRLVRYGPSRRTLRLIHGCLQYLSSGQRYSGSDTDFWESIQGYLNYGTGIGHLT
jgi:hypothetical protein